MIDPDGHLMDDYSFVKAPRSLKAEGIVSAAIVIYDPFSKEGCMAHGEYISHEKERRRSILKSLDDLKLPSPHILADKIRDMVGEKLHLPKICREVKNRFDTNKELRIYARGAPYMERCLDSDIDYDYNKEVTEQRELVQKVLSQEFPNVKADYKWAPTDHVFSVEFHPPLHQEDRERLIESYWESEEIIE